jgi:hypothetical protein
LRAKEAKMIGWFLAGFMGSALLRENHEKCGSRNVKLISEERKLCGSDVVIFRKWSDGTITVIYVK